MEINSPNLLITNRIDFFRGQNIPLDEVTGHGSLVLAAHEIIKPEEIEDNDLLVTGRVFDYLHDELGWELSEHAGTSDPRLQHHVAGIGDFDVSMRWKDGRTQQQVARRGHAINGLSIACLSETLSYKEERGTERDNQHVKAAKKFLLHNPGYLLTCATKGHSLTPAQTVGLAIAATGETLDLAKGATGETVHSIAERRRALSAKFGGKALTARAVSLLKPAA